MKSKVMWIIILAFLQCILAAGMFVPFAELPYRFLILVLSSSAVYIGIAILLRSSNPNMGRASVYVIISIGVLYRLLAIGSGPVASDDMYRYVWDGKMQSMGLSPYQYAPEDEAVAMHSTPMLPSRINFPEMKTIYPPLAQWVFYICYSAGGESILAFKLPLLLAEIASIVLLLLILNTLRKPLHYAALYALCPLPVYQFMIDGHVDALLFPFVLLFVYFWLRSRHLPALLSLGFSVITKLVSLIYLPLLLKELRTRWYLLFIPVLVLALSYLPYVASAGKPFESLGVYSMNWTFNGSIFPIIESIVGDNQIARFVVTPILAFFIFYVGWKVESLPGRLYWATFVFLMLAPTVHPWYVAWLAVLLPLYFRWSGLVFIALSALANIVGVVYQSTSVWNEPFWLPFACYAAVYAILIWELAKHKLDEYPQDIDSITMPASS
jgi:alpha-1,6-mannosyltransferase